MRDGPLFEARYWRSYLAMIALAAVTLGLTWLAIVRPHHPSRPPIGFEPGWHCQHHADGEETCYQDVTPATKSPPR